ncbi:MAG: hypothetical protein WCY24_05285 [Lutispora sp.]
MANETMRIFFPLKIITYPQGEYGLDDNPEDITSKEAVASPIQWLSVYGNMSTKIGEKK